MKITINIEGMHCASCASNIERSLKKVSGVNDATVNLIMKKAYVDAEDIVKEDGLRKAIKKLGYEAKEIAYEGRKEHKEHGMHHEMPGMKHEMNKHKAGEGKMHKGHEHYGTIEKSEILSWKRKMLFAWLFPIQITL